MWRWWPSPVKGLRPGGVGREDCRGPAYPVLQVAPEKQRLFMEAGKRVHPPPPWPTQHLPRGLRRVGPEGATRGTWLSLPASPQHLHTDIQFWNSRQSLEGLSVRSVFFGVFQSFVVLLYILDNETNFVVQVSVFIGVLIDLWKITKVMDVRVRPGCHAVSGATRGGGVVQSARPWSWPRGFPNACHTPRTKGVFTPGDFSGHMGQGN